MRLADLGARNKAEPFWHVQIAIVMAIGLQLLLNSSLVFASKYVVVGLELILLVLMSVSGKIIAAKRALAIALIGIIALGNISSLGLVIAQLLTKSQIHGGELLLSSVAIYLTNIILFGILYWELDNTKQDEPDFLFPQMSDPDQKKWRPTFLDYFYISVTNATAFSPTDTMPLTHRAKLMMSVHAMASLATVALVTARAVNILG